MAQLRQLVGLLGILSIAALLMACGGTTPSPTAVPAAAPTAAVPAAAPTAGAESNY